jgi:hypothetical protein
VVGGVESVLVRGRQVYARGEVVGEPGQGRWVRPRADRTQAAAAVR